MTEIDISDKAVHKFMRLLFTKLAQPVHTTWSDNSKSTNVPYCRLYNHHGRAVATAIYTHFMQENGKWGRRFHYEIYTPVKTIYGKVEGPRKFAQEFMGLIREFVYPYLDHHYCKSEGGRQTTVAIEACSDDTIWTPKIYRQDVTLKDVSDKPIKYTDLAELDTNATARLESYNEALRRYYEEDESGMWPH